MSLKIRIDGYVWPTWNTKAVFFKSSWCKLIFDLFTLNRFSNVFFNWRWDPSYLSSHFYIFCNPFLVFGPIWGSGGWNFLRNFSKFIKPSNYILCWVLHTRGDEFEALNYVRCTLEVLQADLSEKVIFLIDVKKSSTEFSSIKNMTFTKAYR